MTKKNIYIDHWENMIAKMEFQKEISVQLPPSNLIFKRVGDTRLEVPTNRIDFGRWEELTKEEGKNKTSEKTSIK